MAIRDVDAINILWLEQTRKFVNFILYARAVAERSMLTSPSISDSH